MRQYCKQSKHFNLCEVIGALVGMWILLAVTAPIIYGGEYLYYRYGDSENWMSIDYIFTEYSQETNTVYMTMCRHVDKKRASTWTWQLYKIDPVTKFPKRIYAKASPAITYPIDDCVQKWDSEDDPSYNALVQTLKSGDYQWQVVVDYEKRGFPKRIYGESNVFTITK